MIYLASPFTHDDPTVRLLRSRQACQAAAAILRSGRHVFSPVAHAYAVEALSYVAPLDHAGWLDLDFWFVERCSFLWVLTLDGWRESKGVTAEINYAAELNKPMRCVSLEECLEGRF